MESFDLIKYTVIAFIDRSYYIFN